jgi:hypothetical protein
MILPNESLQKYENPKIRKLKFFWVKVLENVNFALYPKDSIQFWRTFRNFELPPSSRHGHTHIFIYMDTKCGRCRVWLLFYMDKVTELAIALKIVLAPLKLHNITIFEATQYTY